MSERARKLGWIIVSIMLLLNLEERMWREVIVQDGWHNLADFDYYYNGASAYRTTGRLFHPTPERRTNRADFFTDAPIELKYYLFVPYTFLDIFHAKIAWVFTQHVIYAAAFLLLFSLWKFPVERLALASLVILYDPTWQELAKGQLTCLALLTFLVAFWYHRNGQRLAAGLWLGVACMLKQHFLYAMPFLFLGGSVVPVLAAGGVLALAMLLQAVIDPTFWSQYIDKILMRNLGVQEYLSLDYTTYSMISRLFVDASAHRPLVDLGALGSRLASLAPGVLFGIPAAWRVWTARRVCPEWVWIFSFATMMLVVPNLSMYGLLWNLLPLFYLLERERWRAFALAYLMTGVCVTIYIAPLIFPGHQVPWWFITWPWIGMVLIFVAIFREVSFLRETASVSGTAPATASRA